MNDFGMTLAWLAVQVTLVLAPALVLHVLASRRGPASGAWVAALSLGLVAVLPAAALVSATVFPRASAIEAVRHLPPVSATAADLARARHAQSRPIAADGAGPRARPGWTLADLGLVWARFERGAAAPVARWRTWGSTVAIVATAGTGLGLLRLGIGLWAIGICRRRGRVVDDPAVNGLLDELRNAMGCVAPIEVREMSDLSTPATAGWKRPVLLLPEDWRSWNASERRAVLAHELAHIVRGDYAAGLLARIAVVLNFYHPMVRWMAARLQLQQELAADALGARFAGGQGSYLAALSQLALRQDGRSRCWPARAFLPARGTLIRRIAMLRDETRTETGSRPWSKLRRWAAASGLIGLMVGVASLRGPARAGDDISPGAASAKSMAPAPRPMATPFAPYLIGEDADGVVAIRPSAPNIRPELNPIVMFLRAELEDGFLEFLQQERSASPQKRGALKLGYGDIEWLGFAFKFGRGTNAKRDNLHAIQFSTFTARTVFPFDWLTFLRQCGFEFEEVRENGHLYHRVKGPMAKVLGESSCIYFVDDRTLVYDRESLVRKLLGINPPAPPSFLRNADWERVSRGLLAVAVNNRDGRLAKHYDLGRPDDAVVLSLFKGVDRLIVGVDDSDAIVVRGFATSDSLDASKALGRMIDSLRLKGLSSLADPKESAVDAAARIGRLAKAFLANLRVVPTERGINLHAEGFGTMADLVAIHEAELREGEQSDAEFREAERRADYREKKVARNRGPSKKAADAKR